MRVGYIRAYNEDPQNPKTVARLTVNKDGIVEVDCRWPTLMNQISSNGVVGRLGKTYYLTDGYRFLENLIFHFKSPYLRAEVVDE
jgi:hypothetical protein